jgi:hypothetical protein
MKYIPLHLGGRVPPIVHLLSGLAILLSIQPKPQSSPTYDAVVRGMKCTQSAVAKGQLECVYRVGKSLVFTIAGVGETDAGITVTKASGMDGDFYFGFGLAHGCVIIWPGSATMDKEVAKGLPPAPAFVSPRTGKVYATWRKCGGAKP